MSDKKVIKNILTGETESVEILVQKYYGDIYSYCYRHVFDKDMAQDITQETFLHFLKSLESYKHVGKLKNYLYIIAKNLIKDYLKKADNNFDGINNIPEGYDMDNIVRKVDIKKVLDSLNEDERELVILRYYQDMTFVNISKIVGKPVSTVKYIIKKAEKTIGDMLGGDF